MRASPLLLPLLILAVALSGCRARDDAANGPAGRLGTPEPSGRAAPAAPADGLTQEEAARLLPGVDTSTLTPRQRADLNEVATDVLCPCAPVSVAACLREKRECAPVGRMMELAKRLLQAGQSQMTAAMQVELYINSFSKARRREVAPVGAAKGAPDAPVTVVEFSDFECPACRSAHPAVAELVRKFPRDVRVVFRHFPLPQHENALLAARAAVYAEEKGKFWPFADLAFERQASLNPATIRAIAAEVGLDPDAAWRAATADPRYSERVESDKAAGMSLGLRGTPTIYVNGRQHILPPSVEYLSWSVEDELVWMSNGGAWASK